MLPVRSQVTLSGSLDEAILAVREVDKDMDRLGQSWRPRWSLRLSLTQPSTKIIRSEAEQTIIIINDDNLKG